MRFGGAITGKEVSEWTGARDHAGMPGKGRKRHHQSEFLRGWAKPQMVPTPCFVSFTPPASVSEELTGRLAGHLALEEPNLPDRSRL